VDLFRFIPGYTSAIYHDGKEPLLLLMLGFLITFVLTRAYTRIARVRGWGSANVGGVHMHHVVPGVLIMVAVGIIDFAFTPDEVGRALLAIAFGAGMALTLDEFAMVFHIEDVYWTPEGRSSTDAVIFVTMVTAILLFTSVSFRDDGDGSLAIAVSIAVTAVFSVIALLKGKLKMSVIGILIFIVGIVGAVRLAKPGSWWAQRFYDPERGKRAARKHDRAVSRAQSRHDRWEPRRLRMLDMVGGAPHLNIPGEPPDEPR
jgi:hypothetical protein